MTVDPARAAARVEHDGTSYYFCSKGCAAKFQADPQRYLAGARDAMQPQPAPLTIGGLKPRVHHDHQHAATAAAPAPDAGHAAAVEYTCPMHPEVISDRPGACPKCGMALEPRVVGLEDAP